MFRIVVMVTHRFSLIKGIIVLAVLTINSACTMSYSIKDLNRSSTNQESDVSRNPVASINTLDPINDSNKTSYAISGTCSDVTSVDIQMNGSVITTTNCSGGTWSQVIDASIVSDGSVSFTIFNSATGLSLTSANVIKDVIAPTFAVSVEDGDQSVSTTNSPVIVWSAGSDGGSGLAKYEVRILDSGDAAVTSWQDVGTQVSYSFSGLTLIGGQSYKAEVRAVDNVGNTTSVQGNGWYVLPSGWKQQAYLKASNAEAQDYFGSSVAIYGDTAVVGASGEDSSQTTITNGTLAASDNLALTAGAAYVFKRNGNTWQQEAYLKAPNANPSDTFGKSVSIYGDTIAVGAPAESSNQTTITNGTTASSDNSSIYSGAVYVFKRSGSIWQQEAYIKPPNVTGGDSFGWSVSVHGDTLAVGAWQEDSNQTTITNGTTASADNSAGTSGAVYVFKRTGVNWAQEAYIKASNSEANDRFGEAISLYLDTLAVGATSEASNQTTITNGTTASADNSVGSSGAVYVFKRTGVNWVQEAYVKTPNPDLLDSFGYAVAINEDTIAASAYLEDSNQTTITNGTTASSDNSLVNSGAVYVFKRTGANWVQEAYIKAVNSEVSDKFGSSIALQKDTLLVGAIEEDSNQTTVTNGTTASSDNSLSNSGAVYVYKRTGNNWAQQAYIKAANADASDNFGGSVAISDETVVVGAQGESSNQITITNGTTASGDNSALSSGAAYIYKLDQIPNYSQQAYIKAANADAGDAFGGSVDIDGETLVVGARNEDSNQITITNDVTASSSNAASNSGAAYVYKKMGTIWVQQAYLKAPNAEMGDMFGTVVSISGDTIVVSAPTEDSSQTTITNGTTASGDNLESDSGAVYVFKRTVNGWDQQAYIKAANTEFGDWYGAALSISGDTIAVSSIMESSNQTTITNGTTASSDNSVTYAGAVYVYKRTGNNWAQQAYIKASNADMMDRFGYSVALEGDTLVVGSIGESSNQTTITNGATAASSDDSMSNSGAVYVYKRTGNNWAQQAYLKPPNVDTNDYFGWSVAISLDTIAVGAIRESSNQTSITNGVTASSDNSVSQSGAVYIFKRIGNDWAQEAYIKSVNANASDQFGYSISIERDTLVVGTFGEDSNQTTITNGATASTDNSMNNAGAVYVYRRAGDQWSQHAYIKAPNAEADDSFGSSVAISGETVVVGASGEDSNQTLITNGSTASSNNDALGSGAVYIFR